VYENFYLFGWEKRKKSLMLIFGIFFSISIIYLLKAFYVRKPN